MSVYSTKPISKEKPSTPSLFFQKQDEKGLFFNRKGEENPFSNRTPDYGTQPLVQRKCTNCEKEELQKKPVSPNTAPSSIQPNSKASHSTTSSNSFETKLNSTKSRGDKIDPNTQDMMEGQFGTDFSRVRIHTGSHAVQMSSEIGAQAFTHGDNIYFNQGKYNPTTKEGKHLMAHELTHTIQQKGRVQKKVQKKIGDGHDLQSSRFNGNLKLEAAYDNETLISFGAQGDHVSALQQGLIDSGHPLPKFGVDGLFKSETQGAVKSYQTENGLQVDGVVGPETMGDLDERFSSEIPNKTVPSVPPEICKNLQYPSGIKGSKNAFAPVNFLPSESDGAATTDGQDGPHNDDGAVPCQSPPKKKLCSELCGCPFPLELTGPALQVGDICRPKQNAVFTGESCPDSRDVFQITHIQKNSGPDTTQGNSGENNWVTVFICQGPNRGKIKTIQQRFVHQVETLSLSITGLDSVIEGESIQLEVDGLPSILTPQWNLDQSKKGKAIIIGSSQRPTVEIEGITAGKKEDVDVSISICGGFDNHRITVLPKPKVFTPPTGPCTPSPVDIMRIPGVMRSKGWIKGATLMENWFIGAPAVKPTHGKIDNTNITSSWLNGFIKYRNKIDQMLKTKVYMTKEAKSKIRTTLFAQGLHTPGSTFNLNLDPSTFNSKGLQIHLDSLETAGIMDDLNDMSAALGAFNIKVGVEGKVVKKAIPTVPMQSKVVVMIEKVGFYAKDWFDFNDFQPLGYWNVCTDDVGKTPGGERELVTNGDFRDWRAANGFGQDAFIISKDWDIRKLDKVDTFDF